MKTLNFKKVRIHFYSTDPNQIDIGISLSLRSEFKYIELSLIKWCIEIDW